MEVPLLLVFLFLLDITFSRVIDSGNENITQLQTIDGNVLTDLSNLGDTMNALNALSATQKLMLEQQRAREERILAQNREEEEREAARSKVLETEHKMLEEIRGKVYRKIKVLNRSSKQDLNQDIQGNETWDAMLSNKPKDCSDVYLKGHEFSGVYRIWTSWNRDREGLLVYCDMDTDGGGWTVLHRWVHPTVKEDYFYRTWKDYKNGFGDLESAFWLGNELIYQLTSQGIYEFRFDMENHGEKMYSSYGSFFIGGEDVSYKLHVNEYQFGGSGVNVFGSSNGANFTTFDLNIQQLDSESKPDYDYYDPYGHKNLKSRLPKAGCIGNIIGWWHDSGCRINSNIHPTSDSQELSKTEMKIRHNSFTKKKESPP